MPSAPSPSLQGHGSSVLAKPHSSRREGIWLRAALAPWIAVSSPLRGKKGKILTEFDIHQIAACQSIFLSWHHGERCSIIKVWHSSFEIDQYCSQIKTVVHCTVLPLELAALDLFKESWAELSKLSSGKCLSAQLPNTVSQNHPGAWLSSQHKYCGCWAQWKLAVKFFLACFQPV